MKSLSFTCVDIEYGIGRAVANQSGCNRDQPNTRHNYPRHSRNGNPSNDESTANNDSDNSFCFSNIVFHRFPASLKES